jgi:putative flippase GtrA
VKDLIKKLLEQEKFRFLLVGCFNVLVDVALLNIFHFVGGLSELIANVCSVSIGITISFFLNHYFTFAKKEKASLKSFIQFVAVTGFSAILLQDLVIWIVSVNILGGLENDFVRVNTGKFVAICVGMVWNFLFYQKVVFKKKSDAASVDQFVG